MAKAKHRGPTTVSAMGWLREELRDPVQRRRVDAISDMWDVEGSFVQLRERRKLTIAKLAKLAEVDKAAIERMENGHNPKLTLHQAASLAVALGARLVVEPRRLTRRR